MQVALVTGSARRIGAGIAQHCHQLGYNVIIHANTSVDAAEQLAAELNQQRPDSAVVLLADLRELSACQRLIEQAVTAWGRLDVLVNNASVFFPTSAATATEADWQLLLDINVKAPTFLAQLAYPELKKQGGCVVNLLDVHADNPLKGYSIYSISKAALQMATKALAQEFGPDVRVNAVAPGNILWPEGEANALSDDKKQVLVQRNYLHRQGSVAEVAEAVGFLIQRAGFTTGEVIAVAGGRR